jgi:hypothetical protein
LAQFLSADQCPAFPLDAHRGLVNPEVCHGVWLVIVGCRLSSLVNHIELFLATKFVTGLRKFAGNPLGSHGEAGRNCRSFNRRRGVV